MVVWAASVAGSSRNFGPFMQSSTTKDESRRRFLKQLTLLYLLVAFALGLILRSTHFFARQDLQTINSRFEARRWLNWSASGLKRLSVPELIAYHEAHEIPRRPWVWDYTLSWLIADNHPPVKNKVVIFNRQSEDEPPREALQTFKWMEPLITYPLDRATVGEMVTFLAQSGARAIILDMEFPQYTKSDAKLARAIQDARDGKTSGKPVPVFFAENPLRRSTGYALQLYISPAESGVQDELRKLDSFQNVSKYVGNTGLTMDEDQVVRRAVLYLKGPVEGKDESLVLKALRASGALVPQEIPDVIDIDFSTPPNSELYPVRSLSYLFDPERKKKISTASQGSKDVTVKDAIVVIGDGIVDLYSTPVTNRGVDRMSGSEILVHTMETLSRGSFLSRIDLASWFVYMLLSATGGAAIFYVSRITEKDQKRTEVDPGRVVKNSLLLALTLGLSYFTACLLFARAGLIVPVIEPLAALIAGFVVAVICEREHERVEHVKTELEDARQRLSLERDKHAMEIELMAAENTAREASLDQERRLEFARKINHDLRAPISSLNWTISGLLKLATENEELVAKIKRLAQSSDKLTRLIDELVKSYDPKDKDRGDEGEVVDCDLSAIARDSVSLQQPLADRLGSSLRIDVPSEPVNIRAKATDVSRVMDNLLRNALLHNPRETEVSLCIEVADAIAIVEVSDTGRGISEEHLDRIFEQGYRIDRSRSEGQGLGLNIVKTMTEANGGKISVKSEVGRGTTFRLEWSRAKPSGNGNSGNDPISVGKM